MVASALFARRERATFQRAAIQGGDSMRLIAITGYGQTENRRRALEAGFDAHVTKPVAPEQLAELIDSDRPA